MYAHAIADFEVKDINSASNQLLNICLPGLSRYVEEVWQDRMNEGPEPWNDPVYTLKLHRAGAMAVMLGLASHPPLEEQLRRLPSDVCSRVLQAVGFSFDANVNPREGALFSQWRRSEFSAPHEFPPDDVLGAIYAMAVIEDRPQAVFPGRLAENPSDMRKGTQGLARVWRRFIESGRQQFSAHGGETVIEPLIVPEFAIPDIQQGSTIIDIQLESGLQELKWSLRSLMVCVLLDYKNQLGIAAVGTYQAYRGYLIWDDIDTIIRAASGDSVPSIAALRDIFWRYRERIINGSMPQSVDDAMHR